MSTTQQPETQPKRGRPQALDAQQRKRVVALLDLGCSRRAAARCVGCSPSTITRTAMRDTEFSDEIARAETNLEVQLIQSIRHAATTDRYWRAATWLLERKYPDDYATRSPQLYTPDEVLQFLVGSLEILREEITPDQRDRVIEKLGALLLEFDQPSTAPS